MKRYLSGSHVWVTPWTTVKWGSKEVGLQCRHMQNAQLYSMNIAPFVHLAWSRIYACETLTPVTNETWSLEKAIRALSTIWGIDEQAIYDEQPKFSAQALHVFLRAQDSPILVPSIDQLNLAY